MGLYGSPELVLGISDPYIETIGPPPDILWTADTRRDHLLSLGEYPGFTEAGRRQVIGDIVATGLPVNNIYSVTRRENKWEDLRRGEVQLGSWEVGPRKRGELSIYRAATDWLPREAQAEPVTHELGHANSPLNPNNVALYGGEEAQLEAARFAVNAANQALWTGRYLDGYQRHLADKLDAEEIDPIIFVEETAAIVNTMALTNRKHLEQVQEAQRERAVELWRRGLWPAGVPFTELMSYDSPEGMVLAGADKTLVKLIKEVDTYDDLIRHSQRVKAHFSSPSRRPRPPEIYVQPVSVWVEPSLEDLVSLLFDRLRSRSRN